ncbi:hypothetical protein CLU95_5560 [Variovorax sp. 54]|uniref:hypothetical protein n=1 Tax=Variovorax sp. 54 TaxID=2035212 RepID=UPI000C17FB52|nr:hypothetical protein [Variovorax sp. 54]PIF78373.1 hypothetical protein CLU95_5560 [Variovorax sp. 54]
MHIEERVHIVVPPGVIDTVWSEVDRWHLWDPDTRQARLDGPFAVGTKGRIVPQKGIAFLFGPGVAKQVRAGPPRTMLSLKAYAEQRHNPSVPSDTP